MNRPTSLAALVLGAMALPLAAQTRQPAAPKYTKVLEIDSLDVMQPVLSPNGKWIVYATGQNAKSGHNLWIVPASGGKPAQLTTGDYDDRGAAWFPNSDRLVFRSSRVDGALMTIGVNPASGRATDPPRRLGLEAGAGPSVSPDGRWVVYIGNPMSPTERGHVLLRIVSATGDSPRTLDSATAMGEGFLNPTFSADGKFVEYGAGLLTAPEEIRRVSVTGGKFAVVRRGTADHILRGRPNAVLLPGDGMLVNLRYATPDSAWVEPLAGGPATRITLPGIRPAQFQHIQSPPGSNSLALVTNTAPTEIHVVPTSGGVPRVVRPGSNTEYIDSFLADGRVVIETKAEGRDVLTIMPLPGGTPRSIVLPESLRVQHLTTDGKAVRWRKESTLGVYDVATGASRVISRTATGAGGGDYALRLGSRDEITYVESTKGALDLRVWSPVTNVSRTIQVVRGEGVRVVEFCKRGNLFAWSVLSGDSTTVFLAAAENGPAERVLSVRGTHTDGIAFTADGRRLAFAVHMIGAHDTTHAIGFASLTPAGKLEAPARIVTVGNMTGLTWLPNGTDVLYVAIDKETALMTLSATSGAEPRSILRGERLSFYDMIVSGDGKWVAYPAENPNRSTIWRIDLPRGAPK